MKSIVIFPNPEEPKPDGRSQTRKCLSAELRRNHRVSPKFFSVNLGCARKVSSAFLSGKVFAF
jgi:hypothetical protein